MVEGIDISDGAVTPAMIAAGVAEYCRHCPDTGFGDLIDKKMVRAIYLVMSAARAKHKASDCEREPNNCDF